MPHTAASLFLFLVLLSPIHTAVFCFPMADLDQKFMQVIKEIADLYSIDTVSKLVESATKNRYVNTRQLLKSIDSETREDLSRVVVGIYFAFEDYGRYKDIKTLHFDEQINVSNVLEWVKKKGLNYFKKDPYPYKNKVKTDERRMNEIAWGLAGKYLKQRKIKRKRRWFQKPFYQTLNALHEELYLGISDRSIEEIRKSMTYRLQRSGAGKYTI